MKTPTRILMLGVAYNANIDDMRESPAIKIAELLLDTPLDADQRDYVDTILRSGQALLTSNKPDFSL